jgi:hypothetical protein
VRQHARRRDPAGGTAAAEEAGSKGAFFMKSISLLLGSLAIAAGLSGCAGFFLQGASMHEGAPPSYTARYSVTGCRMTADGSPTDAPVGQTYYVVQDAEGPALLELDASGDGAAIRNHWSDGETDYYFGWVRTSHGWLYEIPRNGGEARRHVFLRGSYSVSEVAGTSRPQGSAAAVCTMSAS